jgi:hypothetical protein
MRALREQMILPVLEKFDIFVTEPMPTECFIGDIEHRNPELR